jgi:cell division protein FtsN
MRNVLLLLSFTLVLISCGDKGAKKEIIPENNTEEITIPVVEKEEPKPALVFTVQIGAFKKEGTRFSSLENVQIFSENNMYKYRLGSFDTYQEARSLRKTMLRKFSDAFVQAVKNNQPISIQEALK